MRYFLTALVFVCMSALSIFGQAVENVETVNSPVQMFQSNVGITGFDMQGAKAGIIWPRGSDNQFVFAIGLWLGAHVFVDETTIRKLVALTYDPMVGKGWFLPKSGLDVSEDLPTHTTTYTSLLDDADIQGYDNPSKRAAEGYPLGLEVEQKLTLFSEGPFKDVAILRSTVRNTHASRDLFSFLFGTVMDVDIGKTTSPQQAALRDLCGFVNNDLRLSIVKFWDDSVNALWNPGVLGVAFIDESPPNSVGTAAVKSWPDADFFENHTRYDVLASREATTSRPPGDLIAFFSKRQIDHLPVGAIARSTMVMMFGSENSTSNDQAMMSLVETLRAAVSVHEEDNTTSQIFFFPNPATASHLYILSDADIDRLEMYTAYGQLVKSLANPSSTIGIEELSAGQYHIIVYKGRDVSHHQLVVLR